MGFYLDGWGGYKFPLMDARVHGARGCEVDALGLLEKIFSAVATVSYLGSPRRAL